MQPTEIIFGEVIKRDTKHKLVWINELGDQPIPLIGFGANLTAFDVVPDGNIVDVDMDMNTVANQRIFQIDPITPQLGQKVCVIRQFGLNRLAHCIGIALSVENYNPDDV